MFMNPDLLRTFVVSYVKPNQVAMNSEWVIRSSWVSLGDGQEFVFCSRSICGTILDDTLQDNSKKIVACTQHWFQTCV